MGIRSYRRSRSPPMLGRCLVGRGTPQSYDVRRSLEICFRKLHISFAFFTVSPFFSKFYLSLSFMLSTLLGRPLAHLIAFICSGTNRIRERTHIFFFLRRERERAENLSRKVLPAAPRAEPHAFFLFFPSFSRLISHPCNPSVDWRAHLV
ncbi:hypothetical protein PENSPDRAFT_477579 [Peniophora sp. CONT]|nr:hypothetical protein PENSPDRAFT_477579 [Peniophora sp. CONT]